MTLPQIAANMFFIVTGSLILVLNIIAFLRTATGKKFVSGVPLLGFLFFLFGISGNTYLSLKTKLICAGAAFLLEIVCSLLKPLLWRKR